MGALEAVILTIITASTPLLLAATGELVTERSGVLNLGVEGMMIMGAVCSFAAAYTTGSALLGILAGLYAGVVMSMLFAFLTQTLMTSQVATGLSLTLLGLGLSGLIGEGFTGLPGVKLASIHIPLLTDIPFIGPILFGQDILVYASLALTAATGYVLFRTRIGLVINAVGNNHHSAHALGYGVIKVRYACIAFGGACSGLAGAYLALAYTTQWIESMSAGRGWIALALVVFSTWLPKSPVYRGLSLRHGLDHGPLRPGYGRRDPVAAIVVLALPRHDSGAGNHFREQVFDQGEHARMHRAALRAREVEGE